MKRYFPALPVSDFEGDCLRGIEIDGRQILIARVGGEFFGASNTCPHAGSPLSMGRLSGGIIQCSLHGMRFRLSDGKVVGAASCGALPVYRTRVKDGIVEVEIPDNIPVKTSP
jgi:nitrite reductase/ring-hydroxylating ferredoxin subunit